MYLGKCYGGPKHGQTVVTAAGLLMVTDEGRAIDGGMVYKATTYRVQYSREGFYYLADGYELTAADRQELGLTCAACPDNGGSGPWCNGCHNG
jgi:hypothetical protein